MKRILNLIPCLALVTSLHAVPAYRGPIQITQPDGTVQTVYQHGDEHFHYLTLADGTWVKQNAEGMLEAVEPLSQKQMQQRRARSRYNANAQTQTAYPLNIAPRGLIILVNYSDVKFQSSNTLAAMQEMLNGDNYTYNGATGSARRYFSDQSFGQYVPQFDVVGPVTLSKQMSYYGQNDSNDDDMHVEDLVQEACKLADTQCNVDFSLYDNDGDGKVDFVFFIYAGYNEAEGAAASTIWPHFFWLNEQGYNITLRLDGKLIDAYACTSELQGTKGTTRCGIGTFCHEFSHVLGLPDLYATNNANHKTMGEWDVLDAGPYNNSGRTPAAYSAYERFFLGWLKPVVLNEARTVNLSNLNDSRTAAIITLNGTHNLIGNDPDPVEFYILENRQRKGWDRYLPGHGMLITRIRYDYNKWYQNTVNNTPTNMRVDLMEADKNTPAYGEGSGYYGKAGDAFPQGAASYTPYAKYPITSIAETDGVITFDFMGGGAELDLTAVEDIVADPEETVIAVYNMLGQLQGTTDLTRLGSGLYIVKTNLGAKKISIR